MALHHVIAKLETSFQSFPEKKANCVIFSDSLSVLETLDELDLSTKAIRDLALQISSFIERYQVTLYSGSQVIVALKGMNEQILLQRGEPQCYSQKEVFHKEL